MELLEQARAWLSQDPDPETRAELQALIDKEMREELEERFSGTLQFGTAGLRGELGAGPNRMNRIVVARAALAIGRFLEDNRATYADKNGNLSVVIGFDGRKNSDSFALDSSRILAARGIKAMLFDRMVPTPVAAFTGKRLAASATIMVTASHNPPRDNGYKVYLGGPIAGSQLVPPQDGEIAKLIAEVSQTLSYQQINQSDDYQSIGEEEVEQYLSRASELFPNSKLKDSKIKITHTALHGVGWSVIDEIFRARGCELIATEAQREPDGNFPTVSFPNPEEPGAMDLSIETAKDSDSDLILANDPDADRLAVAVKSEDDYRMLTGDEVGLILADYVGRNIASGALANSLVSADISAVAAKYSLDYEQTLTGFKWISKVPNLVYGYEEALGYCVDPEHTADKDGITAALAIAELAAELKLAGKTLIQHLEKLQEEFGLTSTGQVSIRVSDLGIINKVMTGVRANPPKTFKQEQLEFEDLSQSETNRTDAVVLSGDKTRMIFRPSGTEPKLKCYLQVRGTQSELEELKGFARELISAYQ